MPLVSIISKSALRLCYHCDNGSMLRHASCFMLRVVHQMKSSSSPALALCSQMNVCLLPLFPPPRSSRVSSDSSTFISILSLLSSPCPNTLIHGSIIDTCIHAITEHILSPNTAGSHLSLLVTVSHCIKAM